jgi:hypothetical protein
LISALRKEKQNCEFSSLETEVKAKNFRVRNFRVVAQFES